MDQSDRLLVPHVQLRHNSIIGYDLVTSQKVSTKRMENMARVREGYTTSDGIIQPKAYSGTVSEGAQRRIKKAIDLLIQTSQLSYNRSWNSNSKNGRVLVFVTLTVPDNTISIESQKAAGHCLAKFLRWMRTKQSMNSYIWKLERQKRGSYHYHITTNVFVSHVQVRKQWNAYIEAAGLMSSYYATHGHSNPNSTDVHAVYKCQDVGAYLAKYLSKPGEDDVKVLGKVWDCSLNLKHCKRFGFLEDGAYKAKVNALIAAKKLEYIQGDRFYMLKGKTVDLLSLLSLPRIREYDRWVQSVTNYERIVQSKSSTSSRTDNASTTHRPVGTPPVGMVQVQSNRPSQSAQGYVLAASQLKIPYRANARLR